MAEKRLSREMKQEIVRQYYAGKSVREIANEYAYSESSIYRWIREFPAPPMVEEYADGFQVNDLGWMFSMMGMVREDIKLVRDTERSSWFLS
jgi:predicted DNA-binding protein YlxM (UPF0122 family)